MNAMKHSRLKILIWYGTTFAILKILANCVLMIKKNLKNVIIMSNWLSICKNHYNFPFICMTFDLLHSFNSHPQLLHNIKNKESRILLLVVQSHRKRILLQLHAHRPGQPYFRSTSLSLSHSSNYYIAKYLLLSIYFS